MNLPDKVTRTPVAVSLPTSLIKRMDALGKRAGLSRSRLFEKLLVSGERLATRSALAEELEAYYGSMRTGERGQDEALSLSFAQAGRAVAIDEARPRAAPARRRRAAGGRP